MFFLVMAAVLMSGRSAFAQDDFQYRQLVTVKLYDGKKLDFSMHGQVRWNHDVEDTNFYLISPQLKYDVTDNLALGLNYTYLETKVFNASAGRDEFRIHHRIEPEIDPHWELTDWVTLSMMNRYEFRWVEDQGWDNGRFRHRTQFEFPVKNMGRVKSFYTSSEFFYDFHDHRYNENWTVPLGIKFKINPKSTISAFYMIQSKNTNQWTTGEILGSALNVSF